MDRRTVLLAGYLSRNRVYLLIASVHWNIQSVSQRAAIREYTVAYLFLSPITRVISIPSLSLRAEDLAKTALSYTKVISGFRCRIIY